VVATPDVSAPLPPPQPPLSPVKVPTIPPEYDLTAPDMNRLAFCMKLASKTDQVELSPIKPRNVSQSLVCPPHYFAWGHDWSDALRTLYYWYHGLTKEEQKREKKKWANLSTRQKYSYNDNIKTLEDNRPAPLSQQNLLHRKKALLLHSRCLLHDLLCVSSNERQSVCRLSVHCKMVPLRLPVLQRDMCPLPRTQRSS
jgi:hypothetical protein